MKESEWYFHIDRSGGLDLAQNRDKARSSRYSTIAVMY